MRIGPVKYDEQEEKIFVKSSLLSLLIGVPSGVITCYLMGFLIRKPLPDNVFERISFLFFVTSPIYVLWWLLMSSFSLLLYWRKQKIKGSNDVKRCLFSSIIIPFMWIYTTPILDAIFTPLNRFLLQYYSPYGVFWITFLVAFPFVLLGVYVILPDLRPRIRRQLRLALTRHFWREMWKNPKSRRKIKGFIALLIIIVILHLLQVLT